MTQTEKQRTIQRLINFKKNYNFTNRQIAQELKATEASVSNWINKKITPQQSKIEDIISLLNKYCTPGIIKIPENKHWGGWLFLVVDDVLDPYNSYCEEECTIITGEEEEIVAQWMLEWSKDFPTPEIYKTYEPNQKESHILLDCMHLNNVIEFKDCFINHKNREEVFDAYPGLDPSGFDYELMSQLLDGEVNEVS